MNANPQLKRVLFVDDSLDYLEIIRRGITHWSRGQWDLVLTPSTVEAFTILDTQHIDLIVIDLRLGEREGMDGVGFLKQVHRKHPRLRKAMLTGSEEDAPCKDCLAGGADLYLIKLAGLETIFHSLNQLLLVAQEGFSGLLRKVSLTDLIQLECLNHRTSILEVSARNFRGEIYIKQGNIVHASAGSKTGAAAVIRLMKLSGGDFHLKPYSEPAAETIHTTWEQLLMEAAQAADEVGETGTAADLSRNEAAAGTLETTGEPAVSVGQAAAERPEINEPRHPRAAEVLVVGNNNAILFDWQCGSTSSRSRLLRFLQEKCQVICRNCSMGVPALIDLQQSTGRVFAHFQPTHRSFCRTEYQNSLPNPEATHV
jgi:CheY-like chemotaxis protein